MKYGISRTDFQAHIEWMIANPDKLYQSAYTNFCGYYALIRIWIKTDPDAFRAFANSLYDNDSAALNGHVYPVRIEIRQALEIGLTADPTESFGNLDGKLPGNAEMLLFLTLAQKLSMTAFTDRPYNNQKHFENTNWAGMTIGSQERFVRLFGFEFDSYGDNIITEFRAGHIQMISDSVKKGFPVIMLVNSYKLSLHTTEVFTTRETERLEDRLIGTHWITLQSYTPEISNYWDFGYVNGNNYNNDIFKVTAGVVILKTYTKPNTTTPFSLERNL